MTCTPQETTLPKNLTTFVAFIAAAFMVGLCVGALNFRSVLHGVSFADMTLVLLTYLGICFAAHAYYRWLDEKKREDSYQSTRNYLEAVDEAQESLRILKEQFNLMCPAPGVIIESSDTSLRRLGQINDIRDRLHQALMSVLGSRRELKFWRVSLVPEFQGNHESMVREIRNLSVIASTLENQLFHYKIGDGENMKEVIREKEMFDEKMKALSDITESRIERGFEGVFSFNE